LVLRKINPISLVWLHVPLRYEEHLGLGQFQDAFIERLLPQVSLGS
jgi:hypothetical protein